MGSLVSALIHNFTGSLALELTGTLASNLTSCLANNLTSCLTRSFTCFLTRRFTCFLTNTLTFILTRGLATIFTRGLTGSVAFIQRLVVIETVDEEWPNRLIIVVRLVTIHWLESYLQQNEILWQPLHEFDRARYSSLLVFFDHNTVYG